MPSEEDEEDTEYRIGAMVFVISLVVLSVVGIIVYVWLKRRKKRAKQRMRE